MKVELEKLIVGIGGITRKAFVGILNKNKTMWLHKIDVDDSFVASVIDKWLNKKEIVTYDSGESFEISVKKLN